MCPTRRQCAQDAVEYGLLLATIAIAVLLGMATFGHLIEPWFAALECRVMTICGYVDNEEDLVDAIGLRGLADVRLPRPLPGEPRAALLAWGPALRLTLLEHPSLPMIFLSQPVIGPGILCGIEALLGALSRAGIAATFGLHAIYAVVIYTAGFVAWELPRTRQPASAYAAAWRREFASLPREDFPFTASVLDELPRLAGEQQFEIGLAALADGLLDARA